MDLIGGTGRRRCGLASPAAAVSTGRPRTPEPTAASWGWDGGSNQHNHVCTERERERERERDARREKEREPAFQVVLLLAAGRRKTPSERRAYRPQKKGDFYIVKKYIKTKTNEKCTETESNQKLSNKR